MAEAYLLAHDLGTSGCKASLFTPDLSLMGSVTISYLTSYPNVDWAEQDPWAWWTAFCKGTRALLERSGTRAEQILSVSFSGQMMGCVAVDAGERPLGPAIIWADQRSRQEAAVLHDGVGAERVYAVTGNRLHPTYPICKFMWFKANRPEAYERTKHFLQAKDFVVLRLTGEWVTDYSDASTTGAWDLRARRWSCELLEAAGLDLAKFPRCHPSGTVVGRVRDEVTAEAGLVAGTPVVLGGGDGPCSTVGTGVVEEGQAYVYLGSSSWISLASREPAFDAAQRTFNVCHLDPGLVNLFGTMQCGGGALRWFADTVGVTETALERVGFNRYALLDAEAQRARPGAGGVLFLPYLMGERSPHYNTDASGAFLGLTFQARREDLARAVLEGVGHNLRLILDAFREQGLPITEVRAIGGGASSSVWLQVLADILGETIWRVEAPNEATARGAAAAGAVALGLMTSYREAAKFIRRTDAFHPSSEERVRQVYACSHHLFQQAYKALHPFYPALHEFGEEVRGRREETCDEHVL